MFDEGDGMERGWKVTLDNSLSLRRETLHSAMGIATRSFLLWTIDTPYGAWIRTHRSRVTLLMKPTLYHQATKAGFHVINLQTILSTDFHMKTAKLVTENKRIVFWVDVLVYVELTAILDYLESDTVVTQFPSYTAHFWVTGNIHGRWTGLLRPLNRSPPFIRLLLLVHF